jgi:hypothetical protein
MNEEYWKSYSHPKRVAWRRAMSAPVVGRKKWRGNPGCYGVCCDEYRFGGRLCTVCHKYGGELGVCCGHYTVEVNPRIRVPPVGAKGRWKAFLKRFPRYRYKPELRVPADAPPDRVWAVSKHDATRAPNSKKKWKRSERAARG